MKAESIKFICKDKKHLLEFGILRREIHRFYMRHYDMPIADSKILTNLGLKIKNNELKIIHCDEYIKSDDNSIEEEYYFVTKFSDKVEALELKRILKLIYSIKYSNFLGKKFFLQYITVEPLKENDKNES